MQKSDGGEKKHRNVSTNSSARYLSAQYDGRRRVAGSHNADINSASLVFTSGTRSKARQGSLIAVPLAGQIWTI